MPVVGKTDLPFAYLCGLLPVEGFRHEFEIENRIVQLGAN